MNALLIILKGLKKHSQSRLVLVEQVTTYFALNFALKFDCMALRPNGKTFLLFCFYFSLTHTWIDGSVALPL